jgi:hypothetical protein
MPGGQVEVEVADDLAVQLIGTAELLYDAELAPSLAARLAAAG